MCFLVGPRTIFSLFLFSIPESRLHVEIYSYITLLPVISEALVNSNTVT